MADVDRIERLRFRAPLLSKQIEEPTSATSMADANRIERSTHKVCLRSSNPGEEPTSVASMAECDGIEPLSPKRPRHASNVFALHARRIP